MEHILFTQPGMRYCQAQALVHSLMKDETFSALSELEKTQAAGRILEEVRGRMLEDIVLLETMKSADREHRVFKLQFAVGEFDMVIYDEKENCCEIFEIKHSDKQVPGTIPASGSTRKNAIKPSSGLARSGGAMSCTGARMPHWKMECSTGMWNAI